MGVVIITTAGDCWDAVDSVHTREPRGRQSACGTGVAATRPGNSMENEIAAGTSEEPVWGGK